MLAGSIVCIIHKDLAIYKLLASKKKVDPSENFETIADPIIAAEATAATVVATLTATKSAPSTCVD